MVHLNHFHGSMSGKKNHELRFVSCELVFWDHFPPSSLSLLMPNSKPVLHKKPYREQYFNLSDVVPE